MEIDIWMLVMLVSVVAITTFVCSILGKYFSERYIVALPQKIRPHTCRQSSTCVVTHYKCCLHEPKNVGCGNDEPEDEYKYRENGASDENIDPRVFYHRGREAVHAEFCRPHHLLAKTFCNNELAEASNDNPNPNATFKRLGIQNESKTYLPATRQLENRNLSPMTKTPSPKKRPLPKLNLVPPPSAKNPRQKLRFYEDGNSRDFPPSQSRSNNVNVSVAIHGNPKVASNNNNNRLSDRALRSKVKEVESSSYLNAEQVVHSSPLYNKIVDSVRSEDDDDDLSVFSDDNGKTCNLEANNSDDDMDVVRAELQPLINQGDESPSISCDDDEEMSENNNTVIPKEQRFTPGNSGMPLKYRPKDYSVVNIDREDVDNRCPSGNGFHWEKLASELASQRYSYPTLPGRKCQCHRNSKKILEKTDCKTIEERLCKKMRKFSYCCDEHRVSTTKPRRQIQSDSMASATDSMFREVVSPSTILEKINSGKKEVLVNVRNVGMSTDNDARKPDEPEYENSGFDPFKFKN